MSALVLFAQQKVIGRCIVWSELIASGPDDAVAEWRAVQPGLGVRRDGKRWLGSGRWHVLPALRAKVTSTTGETDPRQTVPGLPPGQGPLADLLDPRPDLLGRGLREGGTAARLPELVVDDAVRLAGSVAPGADQAVELLADRGQLLAAYGRGWRYRRSCRC